MEALGKKERLKLEMQEKSLAQEHQHPQPPVKRRRFPAARVRSFLTVRCYGKPLARPCEVIQTHFVAMLEPGVVLRSERNKYFADN